MFYLTKFGDRVDTRATYEYTCDSMDDLQQIPKNKINFGSIATVLTKEKGLLVFMADSNLEWIEI